MTGAGQYLGAAPVRELEGSHVVTEAGTLRVIRDMV